jgi:long-subunit acyl-CoA synthetase (AMP-forming)
VEQRGPDTFVWIDRVKNIIKLAQGEYVSVSRLEEIYVGNSTAIRQMYIYGNSLRSYLVAVVVPQIGKRTLIRPLAGQPWSCGRVGYVPLMPGARQG